jgi:hypothetical protein
MAVVDSNSELCRRFESVWLLRDAAGCTNFLRAQAVNYVMRPLLR